MPRRKRSYVPKIKGCYECSQRRIDCDGTAPACSKCAARGIECSGFGMKFKFRDGLAPSPKSITTRNRRQSDIDTVLQQSSSHYEDTGDNVNGSSSLSTDLFGTAPESQSWDPSSVDFSTEFFDLWGDSPMTSALQMYNDLDDDPEVVETLSKEPAGQRQRRQSRPEWNTSRVSLILDLSNLEPWKEFLLAYFSDRIAPEMVVFDDDHNGWRHLILPIAGADELIMSAVLSVSAFHLAGTARSIDMPDPSSLYAKAIRELQSRRDLTGCNRQTKQFVVLALVVLLVAVMVNGCSDFPIMFQMLQSALDAVGGENGLLDGGEVAEFTLRQIHKMRVYAAPLLSQDQGVQAMMSQAQESFECLHYYSRLHPKHSSTFNLLGSLRQQAFNIYLDRVLGGGLSTESTGSIDLFMETVKSFPEGSPGEHVLVWPVFIAASESNSLEHHVFFEHFLERQYQRNGFANILRALELLKKIWSRSDSQDWPALLPEPQVFIM
ncbi:hypothetical protein G7046_g812 [Stylonectria norvegica]|nr:hypothetical protein G7046_g812 [Stylonectria norvegica]